MALLTVSKPNQGGLLRRLSLTPTNWYAYTLTGEAQGPKKDETGTTQ
jgi:hypothetical protein